MIISGVTGAKPDRVQSHLTAREIRARGTDPGVCLLAIDMREGHSIVVGTMITSGEAFVTGCSSCNGLLNGGDLPDLKLTLIEPDEAFGLFQGGN